MKKNRRRIFAAFLACIMMVSGFYSEGIGTNWNKSMLYAATDSHWYSQQGWKYNGKTLTSLCYITSYAMILKNMGFDVDPVDVYVANGKSNYCNHTTISKYYGVDSTSETGSLSSKTTAQKKEFIKGLIEKYPQGVIVGGNYGSGTHYMVAKKVEDDEIYFDDPAKTEEKDGCCIPISSVYRLTTWPLITTYRVVKNVPTASPTVTATPKATTTPKATATPKPTAVPEISNIPEMGNGQVITGDAIASDPYAGTSTQAPIQIESTTTAKPEIAEPTVTPVATAQVVTPSATNPLGKYKVPTRTIYYKSPVMTGSDVKWIEASLKKLGYKISLNGKFSKSDRNIVKQYQKKKKLSSDGYVGKATRAQLLKDVEIAMTKVSKVSGLKITADAITSQSEDAGKTCSFTAKWKANKNVTGYVLVYSTSKSFSGKSKLAKTTNEVVVSDLHKDKTYYVKVRAYKKVNGTKVYGAYSAVKKIKL